MFNHKIRLIIFLIPVYLISSEGEEFTKNMSMDSDKQVNHRPISVEEAYRRLGLDSNRRHRAGAINDAYSRKVGEVAEQHENDRSRLDQEMAKLNEAVDLVRNRESELRSPEDEAVRLRRQRALEQERQEAELLRTKERSFRIWEAKQFLGLEENKSYSPEEIREKYRASVREIQQEYRNDPDRFNQALEKLNQARDNLLSWAI